MPLGVNNFLPMSVASECRKCGKILASFVDPRQAFGPDKVIPPHILANAKGLAILTVLKAGFIGSGRYGNGVVVARTANGSWSAPSAIGTGGAGFGGQIGFELTDFVFILNDAAAVRTFSQQGSITLGGNVSIAAGPVGRNAEAAGAASLKGVAGVFAYSKTKGLFAGVSLEGSMIIERRKANRELYNMDITAKEILEGKVDPPQAAAPLMSILNSRVFDPRGGVGGNDYNDTPVYDDRHDDVVWEGRTGPAYGEGVRRTGTGGIAPPPNEFESTFDSDRPRRATTWGSDATGSGRDRANSSGLQRDHDDYRYSDHPGDVSSKKQAPGRPVAPKPVLSNKMGGGSPGVGGSPNLRKDEVVALFTFDGDQPGDLSFKKGDVIQVTKRTENDVDWWTGINGTKTGIFPSNYVQKQ